MFGNLNPSCLESHIPYYKALTLLEQFQLYLGSATLRDSFQLPTYLLYVLYNYIEHSMQLNSLLFMIGESANLHAVMERFQYNYSNSR